MPPSTFMPWFSWCPWAYVFFFMCYSVKIGDLVVDQTRMDRSLCGWSLHIMLFFTLFFKNRFSSIWIDNEKKNPVRMHFGSLMSLFFVWFVLACLHVYVYLKFMNSVVIQKKGKKNLWTMWEHHCRAMSTLCYEGWILVRSLRAVVNLALTSCSPVTKRLWVQHLRLKRHDAFWVSLTMR